MYSYQIHSFIIKVCKENEKGVVLRLSLNMVGDDKTNFPHKLLLSNCFTNLCKAFANK